MRLSELLSVMRPGTMVHIVTGCPTIVHDIVDHLDIDSTSLEVINFFAIYDEFVIVCR